MIRQHEALFPLSKDVLPSPPSNKAESQKNTPRSFVGWESSEVLYMYINEVQDENTSVYLKDFVLEGRSSHVSNKKLLLILWVSVGMGTNTSLVISLLYELQIYVNVDSLSTSQNMFPQTDSKEHIFGVF